MPSRWGTLHCDHLAIHASFNRGVGWKRIRDAFGSILYVHIQDIIIASEILSLLVKVVCQALRPDPIIIFEILAEGPR